MARRSVQIFIQNLDLASGCATVRLEAGRLAGLNVLGLLPEPHAAALAYAIEKATEIKEKYFLVYNLGDETFDVTLTHANGGKAQALLREPHAAALAYIVKRGITDWFPLAYSLGGATFDIALIRLISTMSTTLADSAFALSIRTLCSDGDGFLGGNDWDRALAQLVASKVIQQHGIDITQDLRNQVILLDACQKAKRDLGRIDRLSVIADLQGHAVEVSRDEFEECTRHLLCRTQWLLEKVLKDAGMRYDIGKDKIDVLLSGGASRMPMISRMIESVMGKPPLTHNSPEFLGTIGAAYWSYLIQQKHKHN